MALYVVQHWARRLNDCDPPGFLFPANIVAFRYATIEGCSVVEILWEGTRFAGSREPSSSEEVSAFLADPATIKYGPLMSGH